jgi:hypothetical protein
MNLKAVVEMRSEEKLELCVWGVVKDGVVWCLFWLNACVYIIVWHASQIAPTHLMDMPELETIILMMRVSSCSLCVVVRYV